MSRHPTSRRTFLLGAGAAMALAACAKSKKKAANAGTSGSQSKPTATDVQFAAVAASIEILAVQTYAAALGAANAGKLGAVPPAVGAFAQTAMKQHQDHADAWNAVVVGAGKRAVAIPDPAIKPQVDQQLATVKDIPGLARLALDLENKAAATYLNGVGTIQGKALATAASIQPVEMQHAAILNFVLGSYPVPDAFAKTDGARPLNDITI